MVLLARQTVRSRESVARHSRERVKLQVIGTVAVIISRREVYGLFRTRLVPRLFPGPSFCNCMMKHGVLVSNY